MSEHPFKKLVSGYHERAASRSEAQYEDGRVEYVLKTFKIGKSAVAEIRRMSESQHNTLTFAAFNSFYASFPVHLGASTLGGIKLHLDKLAMLPALLTQFHRVPFLDAFNTFQEGAADTADSLGKSVGLVFPRKGVRHGLVIVESGNRAVVGGVGSSLVYRDRKDRVLHVMAFQAMIEHLHKRGHGWRPS